MTATPLVIDAAPSDIRVLASGLELRNRKAIRDSIEDNRRSDEQRRKKSAEVLDRAAEVGAEFILDASTKTRYAPLEERMKHYHPNE